MSTLSTIDENPQSDSSQAAPGPSAPLLGFRLHLVREGDDDDMDYEPASVTEADEEDEMDEDEAQDDDGETEGEYHGELQFVPCNVSMLTVPTSQMPRAV